LLTSPIKLVYKRTFSGMIWRILPDASQGFIALECRNQTGLELSYFVVDLSHGTDKQILKPKEVNWWSTFIWYDVQHFYFLLFENNVNPGPGNYIRYDLEQQQVTDQLAQFQLKEITNDGIIASVASQKNHFIPFLRPAPILPVSLPNRYGDPDTQIHSIRQYLQSQGIESVQYVDYLELPEKQCVILSPVVQSEKDLDRFILVIVNNKIELKIKIDTKMRGTGEDGFIVTSNHLIFVENLHTLNIYEL